MFIRRFHPCNVQDHLGPAGNVGMAYLLTTGPVVNPLVRHFVARYIPSVDIRGSNSHEVEKHDENRNLKGQHEEATTIQERASKSENSR